MEHTTNYLKSSSYEAKKGEISKVLLLYSGGLDTSVILKWIQDYYQVPVVTLTLDIGQQADDLESIKQKAINLGSEKSIVYDAKDEFAEKVIAKGIKANACYQGDYHLSTPMGRVVTAEVAVKIAEAEDCDVVAHGCTGKGNDQVRFEGYILALNPEMKILAPVREWNMDRDAEIEYAIENNIPVPAKKDFPYSVDDNMWGMTWEGGEIEDPGSIPNEEKFLTTYTHFKSAPEQEELIGLEFDQGIPVKLNGESLKLADLIYKLNQIAGKHGVGVVHMLEDRLIGLKDRGVYELPAAHVIIKAHKMLEQSVSTRELNELKAMLDIKWGYLCYAAKWFDPAMEAINAFNAEVNKTVTGKCTIRLYKGTCTIVALESPFMLGHASFNTDKGAKFNTNASAGFIEIYSLQMKMAQQLKSKLLTQNT
jgi:argininosuccinate synthase